MNKRILTAVCCVLPFSLFADDDAFRSLVRGILAPPAEQPQPPAPTPPPAPQVVRQYPFNLDYPNIYLGDNGSQIESIFIELVMYGQSQQSQQHFVLISGKSSQGVFQKKMTFANLEELLHFQGILENKSYERMYFYTAKVNDADYTVLKKPRRTAVEY
ncbi:MAG TPA: hypothetical protein DCX06_04900 [Opitutae bacterium]|nr:hypothetical protein [Opitutae bacterium]